MQMGGGLSRRGSRGAGAAPGPGAGREAARERRARSRTPFPERARRRAPATRSCRKRSASPPPSSSASARSPSRASRRARRCATGRAPSRRRRSSSLDVHLERLADNIERLGGHVHWAATAEEAREIVLAPLPGPGRAHGRQVQVHGHRGDRPQRGAGARPGSRRSRPTSASTSSSSPTRSRRTSSRPPSTRPRGRSPSSSRAELGRPLRRRPRGADRGGARRLLREKFLQADMGITGANFAVAETGTVVLVTNEGNGRMVTSLPRIHVARHGHGEGHPVHDRPHGLPRHPGPERDGAEALVLHDAGARARARPASSRGPRSST